MSDHPTEDHGLVGKLEPAASPYGRDAPLISIGISLKRIADALCETRPYENLISRAINEGISNGAQEWIGHMARSGR